MAAYTLAGLQVVADARFVSLSVVYYHTTVTTVSVPVTV
jgi:hypothetical protein